MITQDNGLRSFVAVPSNQIITRAPISPLVSPAVAHHHAHHVETHSDTPLTRVTPVSTAVTHLTHPVAHVTHPVTRVAHTVPHVAHPGLTYSLADVASTGYFTYPGAGIAFQF